MSPIQSNTTTEAIRQRILDVAIERFSRYGYGKTAMADIADDAEMSTANLYRYFGNKLDIASACARNCIQDGLDDQRQAIAGGQLNVEQKLLQLVLTMITHSHEHVNENSHINETVAMITSERPEVVHEKLNTQQGMIMEILAHGNVTGELDIKDIAGTAKTLLSSLILFDVPIFIGLYSKEEFEQRAHDVVSLLMKGLRSN